ncbi:MAG: hypothetical protein ACTSRH_12430 [Promethearchaeota archaeon]
MVQNQIYNRESFIRFIQETKQLIYNGILKNNEFRKEFDNFLLGNPQINKFIENNDMDYSIVITNLEYQFEFIDKLDYDYDFSKFEHQLLKCVSSLKDEFQELMKFKRKIEKEIKNIKSCIICHKRTLNVCVECGLSICETHSNYGYCPKCLEEIIEKKLRKY